MVESEGFSASGEKEIEIINFAGNKHRNRKEYSTWIGEKEKRVCCRKKEMNTTKEDMSKWMGMFPNQTFADGVCHLIGSFGNVGIVDTDEGLVVFDIGLRQMGPRIFKEFREFTDKPIKYIIYSHGHFDHCFGYELFIEEIKEKGWKMPEIIAHENLSKRFEKSHNNHID